MPFNNQNIIIRRALISSWRKEPAVKLARRLNKLGIHLSASGGTADAIQAVDLEVIRLETITGFTDLLGGRVKTLHPAVHAAILARRDSPEDLDDLDKFKLRPFDLVAVDLYPFPVEMDENEDIPVELIDIGGVALIRAAAKNFRNVAVLCRAEQFSEAADVIEKSTSTIASDYLKFLANEAFLYTSSYDARIAEGFRLSLGA